MKKAFNKRLHCAKYMPELKHKVGEEYDITKSEVVKWLISQPDIQEYIFKRVSDGGASALIKYNPETKTWRGTAYEN